MCFHASLLQPDFRRLFIKSFKPIGRNANKTTNPTRSRFWRDIWTYSKRACYSWTLLELGKCSGKCFAFRSSLYLFHLSAPFLSPTEHFSPSSTARGQAIASQTGTCFRMLSKVSGLHFCLFSTISLSLLPFPLEPAFSSAAFSTRLELILSLLLQACSRNQR